MNYELSFHLRRVYTTFEVDISNRVRESADIRIALTHVKLELWDHEWKKMIWAYLWIWSTGCLILVKHELNISRNILSVYTNYKVKILKYVNKNCEKPA